MEKNMREEEKRREEIKVDTGKNGVDGPDLKEKLINRIKGKRADRKNTDNIAKALKTVALCLSFVSFLSTAEGMERNIFAGHPMRAHFVSVAIQTVMFVLSIRLPYYWSQNREKWLRYVIGGIYAFSLMGSVFFGFIYISNLAYSINNRWDRDAQLYMEESYREVVYELEDILNNYEAVILESMTENLSVLGNALAEKSGDDAQISNGNLEIDSEFIDGLPYKEDTVLQGYIEQVRNLAINYSNKAAEILLEDLEKASSNIKTTIEQDSAIAFATGNQSGELKTLRDKKDCYDYLVGIVKNISSKDENEFYDAVQNVMAELAAPVSNNDDDIEKNLQTIYKAVTDNSLKSKSAEELSDQITAYRKLQDSVEVYKKIQGIQSDVENLKKRSVAGDVNFLNDSFEKEVWVREWKQALEELKISLQEVPAYVDNGNSDNESVEMILAYKAEEKISDLNNKFRKYDGNLSDIEQSGAYLGSHNSVLAWITFFIALYLDLIPLGVGLFLYARRRLNEEQ